MRKNIKNDKVIRAITIGLATMMATTSMPMTVLADETTGGGESEDKEYSSTEETASATSDEARKSADDAGEAADTVANDVNENVTAGEAGTFTTEDNIVVDRSQAIIDVAAAVANDPSYVDTNSGELSTIPVYDKKGNLLNGVETASESTMSEDIESAEEELLTVDTCMTILEGMLDSQKVDANSSGYDLAFNANLEAFKAAVYTYGYDYIQSLDAEAVNALSDEDATKAVLLSLIDTREEIKKYAAKNDYNAQKKVNPLLDSLEDVGGEQTAIENINTAVADGNNIAEEVENEVKKADTAAAEAAEAISETEAIFEENVAAIENAATIEDATKAYDELMEKLDDAETTLAAKQAAYDAAYNAYYGYTETDPETEEEITVKGYKELYNEKQQALDAAKDAYTSASAAYAEALKEYNSLNTEHDTKVKDLADYQEALESAKKNLAEAEADLANAAAKAEVLVNAAEAAKAAVLTDNAAMLEIVDAVNVLNENKGNIWDERDALFVSIMKNYYGPEKLGATDLEAEVVKGSKTYDGDSYNYFVVTYTKDGEKVTEYYNYVLDTKDSNKLLIFKKNDNEVAANAAMVAAKKNGNTDITLYEEGVEVDGYKVNVAGKNMTYSEAELEEAIAEGSVVKIGTVYYAIGDAAVEYDAQTGKANAVFSDDASERKKDGEGNVVRTVVINKEDSAKVENLVIEDVDNDGSDEIVQKYTADQNVIIYHENTLSNDEGEIFEYSDGDEEDAEAAAKAAAKANLEEGDEVESIELTNEDYEVETHQISGTYIPIFSETIDITKMEKSEGWVDNLLLDLDSVKEDAEEEIRNNLTKAGYYVLSYDASYTKEADVHSGFMDWYETVTVEGSATVTYVSKNLVTTDTNNNLLGQDFYAWVSELFGGNTKNTDEKRQEIADKLAEQGKILIDYDVSDGNIGKATFTYIDRAKVAVDGGTFDDADDAMDDFNSKLKAAVAASDAKGYSDKATLLSGTYKDIEGNTIKLADTVDNVGTRIQKAYGYEITYWDKQSESTVEDVVVGQDVYDDYGKIYGYVTQNKNKNNILISQADETLNAKLDEASALRTKYERISAEAKAAQEAVADAKERVEALREILYGTDGTSKYLNVKKPNSLAVKSIVEDIVIDLDDYTLADLDDIVAAIFADDADYDYESIEAEFEKAKEELEAAKEKLKELTDQKEEIAEKLADTIDRLTPRDDESSDEEATGTAGDYIYTAPAATPALMAALPATGVAGVRAARTAGISAAIEQEEETADGSVLKTTAESKKDVVTDDEKVTTVKLEDNEVPLAAIPEDEKANMSWWWLLLVAVAGAAGYEAYKKHQQKKAQKEAAVSESINKEN